MQFCYIGVKYVIYDPPQMAICLNAAYQAFNMTHMTTTIPWVLASRDFENMFHNTTNNGSMYYTSIMSVTTPTPTMEPYSMRSLYKRHVLLSYPWHEGKHNPWHEGKQVSTNTFTNYTPNLLVSNDAKQHNEFLRCVWKELKNHDTFLDNGLKSL